MLVIDPFAYLAQSCENHCIGLEEKIPSPQSCPRRQFICACNKLITNLFYAEYFFMSVLFHQPIPKSRAEVQSIMKVLRLNEHICVQKIRHLLDYPQTSTQFMKSLQFREPQKTESVPMKSLSFERTYD